MPIELTPGATFASYRIVRTLGTGGMGSVHEGIHEMLGRRVAIKVLHARSAEKADARERFVREAQTVARIRHPHVVAIFDVGVIDEQPYIVMEYLEGETLESAMSRMPVADAARATALLLPIASALDAVHRGGIVHRDVKPENIFLARDDKGHVVPKLVDFGIAKDLGAGATGAHHTVVGTPHFMSPEQARGALSLDARTDQYAFGVMLYQAVTGRMPYDADSLYELMKQIDAGITDPPIVHQPGLDPEFSALVMRAMARDADARFPTMRELGQSMLGFASPRIAARYAADFGVDLDNDLAGYADLTGAMPVTGERGTTTTLDRMLGPSRTPSAAVVREAVRTPSPSADESAPAEGKGRGVALAIVLLASAAAVALLWPRDEPARSAPTPVRITTDEAVQATSARDEAPAAAAAAAAAPDIAPSPQPTLPGAEPPTDAGVAADGDTPTTMRPSSRPRPRTEPAAAPSAPTGPSLGIRLER